jgi:hypothetical protein
VALRSATRMDVSVDVVGPAALRPGAVPEGWAALEEPDEPLSPDEPLPPDELLAPDDFGDVDAEGTVVDGVEVEGTVPTGVFTGGVVTVGVVTRGVVTVGVVTGGVVTVGVVTAGTVTGGTVTEGTVTGGTVTEGTVTDGTVIDGVCCAPAGNPLIPSEAATTVAPSHQRRRDIFPPELVSDGTLFGAVRPRRAARFGRVHVIST